MPLSYFKLEGGFFVHFKYSHVSPNDQRLFPFVGGLVLGGVTGAAFSNNRPYYTNNYPMYYQTPYYYPNYYYNQTTSLPPQVNIYNPYVADKVIYEDPSPLVFESETRNQSSGSNNSFESIKNVPIMNQYRSDML